MSLLSGHLGLALFLAERLGPLSWESARPLTSQSLSTRGKSVLLDPWHRKWELIPISSVDPLKPRWSSLPRPEAMSTLYLLEAKYCCLYKCEHMPREGMLFVQGHTVFLQELLGLRGQGSTGMLGALVSVVPSCLALVIATAFCTLAPTPCWSVY